MSRNKTMACMPRQRSKLAKRHLEIIAPPALNLAASPNPNGLTVDWLEYSAVSWWWYLSPPQADRTSKVVQDQML